MKFLLLLLLVAVIGALYLPGQREGTAGVCAALDARVGEILRRDGAKPADPPARAPGVFPSGAALAEMVRRRIPFLPPEVACAAAYWMSVYEPDLRRLGALVGGG
jgi:hypothetical protein